MCTSCSRYHENLIPRKWVTLPTKLTDVSALSFRSNIISVSRLGLNYMKSSMYSPRYSSFSPSGGPLKTHGLLGMGYSPHFANNLVAFVNQCFGKRFNP